MITDRVVKCMEKLHIDVSGLKKRQEERNRARINSKCKELLLNGALACKGMEVGCGFAGHPIVFPDDIANMQRSQLSVPNITNRVIRTDADRKRVVDLAQRAVDEIYRVRAKHMKNDDLVYIKPDDYAPIFQYIIDDELHTDLRGTYRDRVVRSWDPDYGYKSDGPVTIHDSVYNISTGEVTNYRQDMIRGNRKVHTYEEVDEYSY